MNINVPDWMDYNGEKYVFIKDVRGSVRRVVNSKTGDVVQHKNYDDWGQVIESSNIHFQPFGFAGGLYDYHTNLTRFGKRDYDSIPGRWTSTDPIRFEGRDSNLYGYVMGDPINMIDPLGLASICKAPLDGVDYSSNSVLDF